MVRVFLRSNMANGPIHLVGSRRSVDGLRVTRITTEEVKLVMMALQDVREKLGIGRATL